MKAYKSATWCRKAAAKLDFHTVDYCVDGFWRIRQMTQSEKRSVQNRRLMDASIKAYYEPEVMRMLNQSEFFRRLSQ